MSDLVNDVPDVQSSLNKRNATPRARRARLNFFNNLWRPVLTVARALN
jgi:hypothetical protein